MRNQHRGSPAARRELPRSWGMLLCQGVDGLTLIHDRRRQQHIEKADAKFKLWRKVFFKETPKIFQKPTLL